MTLPTVPIHRSDPPGGLSIATATALLNSSMAKIARPGAQLALPTPQFSEPNLPVPPSITPAHTSPPRSAIAASPMLSANNSSDSDSSEDSPSSSYEPQTSSALWSQKEADLFIRSARRRGNDYPAILADLEAAGYRGRTANAVKARYNWLRAKGMFGGPAAPPTLVRSIPRATSSTQASGSAPGNQPHRSHEQTSTQPRPRKRRQPHKPHRWTDEEKQVLLRIGDKHHSSGSLNKTGDVYKDWKKHFPRSQLTPHVVSIYYYSMKRSRGERDQQDHEDDDEGEEEDMDDSDGEEDDSDAGSSCPAPAAVASGRPFETSSTHAPRRAAAVSSPFSKRAEPLRGVSGPRKVANGYAWQEDEVEALGKVHQMYTVRNIQYSGPGPLYKAYCQLMPHTTRSKSSVEMKYRSLYPDSIHRRDSDSGSGSEGSEEESDEHEGDSTMLTAADFGDFPSLEGAVGRKGRSTTPAAASHAGAHRRSIKHLEAQGHSASRSHQSLAPITSSSNHAALSSFTQSFPSAPRNPLPALNILATVQPDGFLFENCVGWGIALYTPTSFKVYTPQHTMALAQAPEWEQPAFAFVVGEGGAVQTVVAPEGTTRGVKMIRDEGELRGEKGEGGEGRVGVEAALCAVDGYKVTVVTWL